MFKLSIAKKLGFFSGLGILMAVGLVANQWMGNQRITSSIEAVGREQTILDGIKNAQLGLSQIQVAFRDARPVRNGRGLQGGRRPYQDELRFSP